MLIPFRYFVSIPNNLSTISRGKITYGPQIALCRRSRSFWRDPGGKKRVIPAGGRPPDHRFGDRFALARNIEKTVTQLACYGV